MVLFPAISYPYEEHGFSDFEQHSDLARVLDSNEVSFRVMHKVRYRNTPMIFQLPLKNEVNVDDQMVDLIYIPEKKELTDSDRKKLKTKEDEHRCTKCGMKIFHKHTGQVICDRCNFFNKNNNLRGLKLVGIG